MAKQKIAIVGGGVGGMSTAIALTNQPGWQDKYDITLYQMGWRLGGKGASGRGPDGRIQEHGLHIWLGFYENAFRAMNDAFGELQDEEAVY
ncbi:MAG: NAD(P)-binding protein, partial [Pseudomonadota bacterium]